MSKELDRLRKIQSDYIKQLDYLPKLEMVPLLKECYYGSLAAHRGCIGKKVGNFLFKTHVYNNSVEVEIRIEHPDDFRKSLCIRHFTETCGRPPTYHSKSLFGKWDKHLEDTIETIRQGQIKYVEDFLAEVNKRIDDLVSELDKAKAEFEMLFD